jgi:hypothetical protein
LELNLQFQTTRNATVKRLLTSFAFVAATVAAQQTGAPPQSGGWPRADQAPPQAPPQYQTQPQEQFPQAPQQQSGGQPNFDQAPPPMSLPSQLTLPAGTWLTVRVNQPLSTDHNQVGDAFTVTLVKPIVAQGFVVARRGETIGGRVAVVDKGGRVKGVSKLALELTDLTAVDGQQLALKTELIQHSAGTSVGRDTAAIGVTTGAGAAIGAGVNGGVGAGVGAAAGLVVGALGVLTTRGRATVVYPEETLTFRTTAPMTIATDRAPQAFMPVSQEDFEPRLQMRRAGPGPGRPPYGPYGPAYGPGPYGPPPPYYYYPYAYGPYPYFYGPSFYFRGGFGGRFRR